MAAILILAVNGQVFPSLLAQFGGSSLQHGLLLTSLFFFFPASSVLSGLAADRSSKRLIIIIGLLLMALSFTLSALFDSLQARTLAVLLFGLGGGAIESQVTALLSDNSPGRERSVINLSQSLFSVGAAAGPFLIVLVYRLKSDISLTAFLWSAALILILLSGFFLLARKDAKPDHGIVPAGLLRLMKNREFVLLTVVIFLYVAAETGTASWLAKYGSLDLGLSPRSAPVCITVFWGGQVVSRMLAGVFKRPLGDRTLLTVSLSFSLAARCAAFLFGHGVFSIVGIGLMGLGMGAVWPTLVAVVGARFKESSGAAVGLIVAAGGLGVPFVQPIVGWLSNPGILGLRYTLAALGLFTVINLGLLRLIPGPGAVRDAGKASIFRSTSRDRTGRN